jgi:hypothetical protein
MASNSRKRKYNKISDEQRNILERYYERGMTGAGILHAEAIKNASDEGRITIDQVKVSFVSDLSLYFSQACMDLPFFKLILGLSYTKGLQVQLFNNLFYA